MKKKIDAKEQNDRMYVLVNSRGIESYCREHRGKDACVFGDTVPDDWPLELIEDRKTWPEDE